MKVRPSVLSLPSLTTLDALIDELREVASVSASAPLLRWLFASTSAALALLALALALAPAPAPAPAAAPAAPEALAAAAAAAAAAFATAAATDTAGSCEVRALARPLTGGVSSRPADEPLALGQAVSLPSESTNTNVLRVTSGGGGGPKLLLVAVVVVPFSEVEVALQWL